MKELFPCYVVDWMVESVRERKPLVTDDGRRVLHELPTPRNLPVVVAVRMSLSFPFLFRAVPLWAIPWELKRGSGSEDPPPRRCLFSDGGLTANLPIRFLDDFVPRWPTLALTLRGLSASEMFERGIGNRPCDRVWLIRDPSDGVNARWYGMDGSDGKASIAGFVGLLVSAMKDWHDNSYLPLPGYRDRVAEIQLLPSEGGLNLDMDPEVVRFLVKIGRIAGRSLSDRFRVGPPEPDSTPELGWTAHRVRRSCSALAAIHEALEATAQYSDDNSFDGRSLVDLLTFAAQGNPLPGLPRRFNPMELITALHGLGDWVRQWNSHDPLPRPRPDISLSAPL
jgi:hypothetical protein